MPAKEFYERNPEKYREARRQWYAENKPRALAVNAEYRAANPELVKAATRKWNKENPQRKSAHSVATRRRRNGFVGNLFEERLSQQQGKCAICEGVLGSGLHEMAASADHCHETKQARGILCKRCNLMLGHARDDEHILSKAIEYLKMWKRTA